MKRTAIALLASALVLQAVPAVQILPAGEFVGRDGRPGDGLTWKMPDEQGRKVAAWLNARHKSVKFQFDYEHQAMLAEENGQPAPASGWATTFEWRDGQGLWATDVEWTARGKQMIEAGEYRYISPTIVYDKENGLVLGVLNASLVGSPNLDLSPVAQERVARLSASFSLFPTTTQEQSAMNPVLKALLAALGLADTATEQEATSAVATLKAQAISVPALTTEIATLKSQAPDPAKWVSVETVNALNTEVAALKAAASLREVDEVLSKAKAEGKVVPAVEPVWREIGKVDIAKLKALVDSTPANPALAGQQQSKEKDRSNGGGSGALTDAEVAICRSLGISPEEYRAGAATA